MLVNFALNSGKGVKKGEVVHLIAQEAAKPLYRELRIAVLKAGGHILGDYRPDSDKEFPLAKDFFRYAQPHQLAFFPEKFAKGMLEQCDHSIAILCETDKHELEGVPPRKIMRRGLAWKPYMDWRRDKESKGKYTWTLALYGTEAEAKEAGLSLRGYWQEIIRGCFLDKKDPISAWRKLFRETGKTLAKINALPIEKLHITGPDADLWIKLGDRRRWMGGSGRNIPSFEIFTSPDWRGTEGWIRFNQPLYRYGVLVRGIKLQFRKGRVIKASAEKNESVLKEMIRTKNADRIGEYSLTDRRFSRIKRFMAETLFDENIGGPYGNTHLALGASYHDCYAGDPAKPSKKDWERWGYNDSSVHTDIISTAPRTVTAHLKNGKTRVIYKNGQFAL